MDKNRDREANICKCLKYATNGFISYTTYCFVPYETFIFFKDLIS